MDSGTLAATNGVRYDQIQRLLKQYELTALNSLGGPAAAMLASSNEAIGRQNGADATKTPDSAVSTALASFMLHRENIGGSGDSSAMRDRSLHELLGLRHAIPVQPFPVLTPSDRTSTAAEKQETVLEGENIACFAVGGEKRLCLPQVLSTVLKNSSMRDINRARSDLSIYCNHCTPEQLHALKAAGILASTTISCGLITKTDAERLCNYLLRQKQDGEKTGALSSMTVEQKREKRRSSTRSSSSAQESAQSSPTVTNTSTDEADDDLSVPVMHLCFGRCRGRYFPRLYASPSAECIECEECGDLFAADRFVMHSHRNQERRTCHWGFDSANWRAYIHLPADAESSVENVKMLEQMKLRFDVTGLSKRKFGEHVSDASNGLELGDDNPELKKRLKLDIGDQAVTNASCAVKLPVTTLPTASALRGFEQQRQPNGLPYLLCDPLFLVAYYQTLLSATATASNTGQTPIHQATTLAGAGICAPSSLPPLPRSLNSGDEAHLVDGLAATTKSGYNLTTLRREQQLQAERAQLRNINATTTTTTSVFDEATAAAALKLLQLRASTDIRNEHAGNVVLRPPPLPDGADQATMITTSIGVQNVAVDVVGGRAEKNGMATNISCAPNPAASGYQTLSSDQHRHLWSPSAKEPLKKHVLHLFAVEQQQKQQFLELQQQKQEKVQEQRCEFQQTDPGRASVEVIVDDDDEAYEKKAHQLETQQQMAELNEATPGSESEKCEVVNGRMSEETQMADESSATTSDTEGAAVEEASLDDLLKRYINDEEGLRAVRAKIAANQRYLEQKMDAVAAENRLLRAECFQLRTKQYQMSQEKEQHNATAGLNFMGLLPRSVKS